MISVVIPLYNKAAKVASTLASVQAQTFQDFEIVIVDDGSTDGSAEVVAAIADPRIRLIHQANAGVSAARNRGIAAARGEFVALLDADDEWKPTYLATQYALTQKYPQCDVFATNYEFKDQLNRITLPIINHLKIDSEDGLMDNFFEISYSSHPPLWSSAVMVTRKSIMDVGGFPEGVRLGEDLITWAKLACNYKIAYTRKVCSTYIFASQAGRLVPDKKPNMDDVVGREYDKLVRLYNIPYLKETSALWHKMRMVTFVQLQMRKEARYEFKKIQSYIKPTKKDVFWYIMSFMPIMVVRFILKSKSNFK